MYTFFIEIAEVDLETGVLIKSAEKLLVKTNTYAEARTMACEAGQDLVKDKVNRDHKDCFFRVMSGN